MSMQIRMACALMDMLRTEPAVTVRMAIDRIGYDEGSLRQALKVLVELGYAILVDGSDSGRTKIYTAGPKLRRPD